MECFTLSSSTFAIDFDEKMFEDHLNAATLCLKDDFSYYYSNSRASFIDYSRISSFLRANSQIKDRYMILDKKIDEALYLYSKDFASQIVKMILRSLNLMRF